MIFVNFVSVYFLSSLEIYLVSILKSKASVVQLFDMNTRTESGIICLLCVTHKTSLKLLVSYSNGNTRFVGLSADF